MIGLMAGFVGFCISLVMVVTWLMTVVRVGEMNSHVEQLLGELKALRQQLADKPQ